MTQRLGSSNLFTVLKSRLILPEAIVCGVKEGQCKLERGKSLFRHVDIVSHLLTMGADPLVPDKVHSRTCLHYAAWNGKPPLPLLSLRPTSS